MVPLIQRNSEWGENVGFTTLNWLFHASITIAILNALQLPV